MRGGSPHPPRFIGFLRGGYPFDRLRAGSEPPRTTRRAVARCAKRPACIHAGLSMWCEKTLPPRRPPG